MLAEVFIFIQHVIGFHISIGKTGLFSSSRYREMSSFMFQFLEMINSKQDIHWDDKKHLNQFRSLDWASVAFCLYCRVISVLIQIQLAFAFVFGPVIKFSLSISVFPLKGHHCLFAELVQVLEATWVLAYQVHLYLLYESEQFCASYYTLCQI